MGRSVLFSERKQAKRVIEPAGSRASSLAEGKREIPRDWHRAIRSHELSAKQRKVTTSLGKRENTREWECLRESCTVKRIRQRDEDGGRRLNNVTILVQPLADLLHAN